MKIHVLPGDALIESFKNTNLDGEIAVCRECLVDGPVQARDFPEFWETRASFIGETYGEERESYFEKVVAEFEKLLDPKITEINLWFENELFCQANFWFTISFVRYSQATLYRVAPVVDQDDNVWQGFGQLSPEDLMRRFAERVKFTGSDRELGVRLWTAFQTGNYEELEKLSAAESPCFPYLKEVCRAAIEKEQRPRTVLREIVDRGKSEFTEIFAEFSRKAGVYGFGDAQVKKILAEI